MPNEWLNLAEKVLAGNVLSRDEAIAVLQAPNDEIPEIICGAYEIRKHHFGNKVKLNYLINVKSGICSEDCAYCSQSSVSQAKIHKYPLLPQDKILTLVERGLNTGAKRICLVASGRKVSDDEIEKVAETVKEIRTRFPQTEICCCLGLLGQKQASELKASGVTAYNHNLNTSQRFYGSVCSTHTYEDRLATVNTVKAAELSPCVGCLFGMGETENDVIDLVLALRDANADSIPINFLMPIPGTALEHRNGLTPLWCLKILCLFRFIHPDKEIRIAGGRELHLGWLQAMGLYPANSIFIGDYLTTKGQPPEDDLKMLADMGFVAG